jgi:glycosyltransferase involved in cell wall biosynthesis
MGKKYLEILSGLGMGGAEKTFLNRIEWAPADLETRVLNTIPEISVWEIPLHISTVTCRRKNIRFPMNLKAEIYSYRPDTVIVRSPIDLIFVASLKFLFHQTWKLVYEAHSTRITQKHFYAQILSPAMKFAVSQTDLVVAASQSVAIGPQCRGATNVRVHHFGADVKLGQDRRVNFKFLFAGRFVALKQPILLLEAILLVHKELIDFGATVEFIGTGPLKEAIVDFISCNDLGSVVKLSDYTEDLNSVYSESEILVSTSQFEGLPLTFFEAKQHGLRIITTPSSKDFDILGTEDVILKDFKSASIAESLISAITQGPLTVNERRSIQEKNRWMNSRECAFKYYELIEA